MSWLIAWALFNSAQAAPLVCEANPAAPWWSVSIKDVRTAPCTRELPFSKEEMLSWLSANQAPDQKVSAQINGFNLKNQNPKQVEALRTLLNSDPSVFGSGKKMNYKSSCATVVCAVEGVFGPTGIHLLYMLERFGYNGSHLSYSEASPFFPSELDDILLALTDLPPHARKNLKSPHPLYKAKRGTFAEGDVNETVLANAVIRLYDGWNRLPSESRRSGLFHELGHGLAADAKDADLNPKWLSYSGWKKIKKDWISARDPISIYGGGNPGEDFAESFAAYRYNPSALKKNSPQKYQMLKNGFFEGLEYTSDLTCKDENSSIARFQSSAKKLITPAMMNAADQNRMTTNILTQCGKVVFTEVASPLLNLGENSNFGRCAKQSIEKTLLNLAGVNLSEYRSLSHYSKERSSEGFSLPQLDPKLFTAVTASARAKITSDLESISKSLVKDIKRYSPESVYPALSEYISHAVPYFNVKYSNDDRFFNLHQQDEMAAFMKGLYRAYPKGATDAEVKKYLAAFIR